jgi:predicted nuclease of predicted toxin-antitoxin system
MSEGLDEKEDKTIWQFSKENGFTIITKDSDFNELLLLNGFPPQIIWIRLGNCKIAAIERIIRRNVIILTDFHSHQKSGILEID